jgi:hypothetical protein
MTASSPIDRQTFEGKIATYGLRLDLVSLPKTKSTGMGLLFVILHGRTVAFNVSTDLTSYQILH